MGIQVTELTNGKACHEKEFIDFEFAGRHISEFGMVAVADGGRHSFDAAPTFEDETSTVNGVDGQYFWGTHFKSKKMTFSLATDGMTEAQVNDFKHHFHPGKYGVFIEDKLACRKAYARVSQVSTFNMVPFRIEKKVIDKNIYINEYKGDCRITFEFDNPYFEAITNLIEDTSDEQALRSIYINGTPHALSWQKSSYCFVGDENKILKQGAALSLTNTVVTGNNIFYYNPSTTKTNCKIELTIQPRFSSTSFPVYFYNIYDDINTSGSFPYNRLQITDSLNTNTDFNNLSNSDYIREFRYTSPDVIYSINKAISMADNFAKSGDLILNNFEEQLRLEIVNPKVMGWAAAILRIISTKTEYYDMTTGNFNNGTLPVNCSYINMSNSMNLTWAQYFNVFMLYMLAHHSVKDINNVLTPDQESRIYHIDDSSVQWSFSPYKICFDGVQNRTYITYTYNQITEPLEEISVEEESCGDMILSEYLNLDGGDILTDTGMIASCHKMRFIQGQSNSHTIDGIKLIYIPTYL